MELVGLVCDGENDLRTGGTRRELRARPQLSQGDAGGPGQPEPSGELETWGGLWVRLNPLQRKHLAWGDPWACQGSQRARSGWGQVKGEAARLGPVSWMGLTDHLSPQGLSHP